MKNLKTRRFTLIELLVTVAIIAILAALLLPALSRAKGYAQSAVCMGQLRQIFVGYEFYRDDYGDYYISERGTGWNWGALDGGAHCSGPADDLLPYVSNAAEVFMCPNKDPDNFFTSWGGYGPNSYGASYTVVGAGYLSQRVASGSQICKSHLFKQPAQTMMFMDSHHFEINPGQARGKPGYVHDPESVYGYTNVVEWRHLDKLNVLYIAGHVEALDFDVPQYNINPSYFWWPQGRPWSAPQY